MEDRAFHARNGSPDAIRARQYRIVPLLGMGEGYVK